MPFFTHALAWFNMDLQLDLQLSSLCISDSKEGLLLRIALAFTCRFYFKGIAAKVYVADSGISHAKIFSSTFRPYITTSFMIVIVSLHHR